MPDEESDTDAHEFVFQLDLAIRTQVERRIFESPFVDLQIDKAPQKGGIYVLYKSDEVVYVGKASKDSTESERSLRGRLNEHVKKVSGRIGLTLGEMKFRYLTIKSDWFVWAAERSLIETINPIWNKSGFGNKDTGSGRDQQKPSVFDDHYPINSAMICHSVQPGNHSAKVILNRMKEDLPYTFRFTKGPYQDTMITIPRGHHTAETLLQIIVNGLGEGWRATILKSHMFLHKKSDVYQHAVMEIVPTSH